jgi:hypothetical protein
VSLENIKTEIAGMPQELQDQLEAYLVHLRHQRDSKFPAEIRGRIEDKDPANWLSLDELTAKWKDWDTVEPYRVLICIDTLQLQKPSRCSVSCFVGQHAQVQ